MGFDDWLTWNLTKVKSDLYMDWKEIIVITLWWLWLWRNVYVFSNERPSIDFKWL